MIVIMIFNFGVSNCFVFGFGDKYFDVVVYCLVVEWYFCLEFVNCIDELVVFEFLKVEDIFKIIEKELEGLKGWEGFQKIGLEV